MLDRLGLAEFRSRHSQSRGRSRAWVLVGGVCATVVLAQATDVELTAHHGGRIVGAAKACSVEEERLWRIGERISDLVMAAVLTRDQKNAATALFISAYAAGHDEVESGRIACDKARAALLDLEEGLAGN